jgi:hypothetical protein
MFIEKLQLNDTPVAVDNFQIGRHVEVPIGRIVVGGLIGLAEKPDGCAQSKASSQRGFISSSRHLQVHPRFAPEFVASRRHAHKMDLHIICPSPTPAGMQANHELLRNTTGIIVLGNK